MASKIEICNMALQGMTANFITSLNENTVEARECNFRFDSARQSLLNMHPWNFAIKRAALNADVTAPAFTYSYLYQLPVDFLYLVMTAQQEQSQSNLYNIYDPNKVTQGDAFLADKYQIEGDKLLSNNENVKIIYVADVADTTTFSATFTTLLSYYLAAHIAFKVTGDRAATKDAMQMFEIKIKEFKTLDSQQGTPNVIRRSNWLSSRNSGTFL